MTGTPLATVQQCLQQALALAGSTLADVAVLASIEAKANEAAFCNWPRSMAGLALVQRRATGGCARAQPSATVQRYMGTPR